MLITGLMQNRHSQGEYGRVKTVLSERGVSVDTSIEEKQFVASHIWLGGGELCISPVKSYELQYFFNY